MGIGAIIILSPFFRGLYFFEDTVNFLILIGIISLVAAYTQFSTKDCRSLPTLDLMDLGFSGLALWYLLSIPSAASIGDAILGAIRVLGYVSLYYASCQLLTKRSLWMGAWILAVTGAANP